MQSFPRIVACILGFTYVSNGVQMEALSTAKVAIQAMEHVFYRSEETHTKSMDSIMRSMSTAKAIHFLRKNNLTTPEHLQLIQTARKSQKKQMNLRTAPGAGYPALDPAKALLNTMIFNATSKYDEEIAMCTDFYAKQCAEMEVCRGAISDANEVCASSREMILYSQSCIDRAEEDIIAGKQKLAFRLLQCKHELYKMRSRLKTLEGDLNVLTTVLKMTDCSKSFVQIKQLQVLKCKDPCTHKTFYTFNHDAVKNQMSQLQTSVGHDLAHESLSTLFNGIQGLQLLQAENENSENYSPAVNSSANPPPVPRVHIPANPCTDPDKGAPSKTDRRSAKCTLKTPDCALLQERFLLIQSGLQDEHDELLDEIDMMEHYCEETKNTLQAQISNNQALMKTCETKLAEATENEATSSEKGRTTAAEHEQLDAQLRRTMGTCSKHYIDLEGQICALKKIRAEIYKMKGATGSVILFQDCTVSKWTPLECTSECGGGTQLVQRTVMIPPNGGMNCLPLEMEKTCNTQPCPIDCSLGAWSGWSKCSSQCGGGVTQRLRTLNRAMRFGGRPCSATSETKSCNAQACEKDCELTDWTAWSTCSKDCDGGTMKREKFIKYAAEGNGHCANVWSEERLEYKACNNKACMLAATSPTLTCAQAMDIVLLIDGSGSLTTVGWSAEVKAANSFVDAFISGGADTQIAVILFSGPQTWGGVFKCIGRQTQGVNLETDCNIKTITHFTSALATVKTQISAMTWPKGSTLTSVALMSAKSELSMGRKDSHAVIIVFTDGRPMSYRKTLMASREVRKAARLVWVPVTKYAPLRYIKKWATRRWEENVVVVNSFGDLEKPSTVTHIIANICPAQQPVIRY